MLILHLLPSTSIGGAEQIAARLCMDRGDEHLSNMGYLLRDVGDGRGRIPIDRTRVVSAPAGRGVVQYTVRTLQVASVIHGRKPAIVQAHGSGAITACLGGLLSMRRPAIVCTMHSPAISRLQRWALRALRLYSLLERRDARLVAVSPTVEAAILACHPRLRVTTIVNTPRAILTSRRWRQRVRHLLGVTPGEVMLLTVGNSRPEKRHGELVRAVATYNRVGRDPRLRLVIVGAPPATGGVVPRSEDVIRLDARGRVGALLSAADAFVSASLYEGYGLALAEAVQAGLPTFSTAGTIPGVRRLGSDFSLDPVVHAVRDRTSGGRPNAVTADSMIPAYRDLYRDVGRAAT